MASKSKQVKISVKAVSGDLRALMEGAGVAGVEVCLIAGKVDSAFVRSTDSGTVTGFRGVFYARSAVNDKKELMGTKAILPPDARNKILKVLKAEGVPVEFGFMFVAKPDDSLAEGYRLTLQELIKPQADTSLERLRAVVYPSASAPAPAAVGAATS